MSNERSPHPKNAPGSFYVENGCCMQCMAPHAVAPTLMGFDDSDQHCFVKRQPQTDKDVFEAIRAMRSSEMQCLRYSGNNADILRRLAEIGEAEACDHPSPTMPAPVLRNHVTFVSTFPNDALEVAIAFRDYIVDQNSKYERFKVTQPTRKGSGATFAYAWFEDLYYSISVEHREPASNRWLVRHSPTWEVGSVAVSLMIDDWSSTDPRFSDFRWFTAEGWDRAGDDWQRLPY